MFRVHAMQIALVLHVFCWLQHMHLNSLQIRVEIFLQEFIRETARWSFYTMLAAELKILICFPYKKETRGNVEGSKYPHVRRIFVLWLLVEVFPNLVRVRYLYMTILFA